MVLLRASSAVLAGLLLLVGSLALLPSALGAPVEPGSVAPFQAQATGTATVGATGTATVSATGTVGMAYHAGRNTVFVLNFSTGVISEINPSNGATINSFSVQPVGSPSFFISFGDLDVDEATGNLLVIGSSQATIRELTPAGIFVRDISVTGLTSSMTGIAVDDFKREAWVAAANRAKEVLKTYPEAPATEEALAILVVAYDKLNLTDLRDDAQRVLKLNFPNSKFAQGVSTEGKAWYRFW